jgi:hypothetical protein
MHYKMLQVAVCVLCTSGALFLLSTEQTVRAPGLSGMVPHIQYALDSGHVDQWMFNAGQKVNKGQVVAQLSIPSIEWEIQQALNSYRQGYMNQHTQLLTLLIQMQTLSTNHQDKNVETQVQKLMVQATSLGEKLRLKTLQKALPSFKQSVKTGRIPARDVLLIEGEIATLKGRRTKLVQQSKLWNRHQLSLDESLLRNDAINTTMPDLLDHPRITHSQNNGREKSLNPKTIPHTNESQSAMQRQFIKEELYDPKLKAMKIKNQKEIDHIHTLFSQMITTLIITPAMKQTLSSVLAHSHRYSIQQQRLLYFIEKRQRDLQIIAPCNATLAMPAHPHKASFNIQEPLAYFYPNTRQVRAWHLPQSLQPPPKLNDEVLIHLPYAPHQGSFVLKGYVRHLDPQHSLLPAILQIQDNQSVQGQLIMIEVNAIDNSLHWPIHSTPLWVSW